MGIQWKHESDGEFQAIHRAKSHPRLCWTRNRSHWKTRPHCLLGNIQRPFVNYVQVGFNTFQMACKFGHVLKFISFYRFFLVKPFWVPYIEKRRKMTNFRLHLKYKEKVYTPGGKFDIKTFSICDGTGYGATFDDDKWDEPVRPVKPTKPPTTTKSTTPKSQLWPSHTATVPVIRIS